MGHTIEAALDSCITRVVVSTDSVEIANVSKIFEAEVPFMRPNHLATDDAIIEDAIFDMLGRLNESEGYVPDIIVLLQPTSPLRTAENIDEAIKLLISQSAEAVVSVSEPMEHPACMARWDSDGFVHFALGDDLVPGHVQRQAFPEYFFINGAIYCFTIDSLEANRSRFSKKTIPYLMGRMDSVDVDSSDEFEIAEAILAAESD